MMKKILKTIVAFSLGLSMMIGANIDGVYAADFEIPNDVYTRAWVNGQEVYIMPRCGYTIDDDGNVAGRAKAYIWKESSETDWGMFDKFILYDSNYNHIGCVSDGYIYGIDGNSIVDGAVIYGDVEYDNGTTSYLPGNVNSYDPSNRDKRPNATLEKYDFNEMVIYDWYSMGNYVRKE